MVPLAAVAIVLVIGALFFYAILSLIGTSFVSEMGCPHCGGKGTLSFMGGMSNIDMEGIPALSPPAVPCSHPVEKQSAVAEITPQCLTLKETKPQLSDRFSG